jgi:hypothetical protein
LPLAIFAHVTHHDFFHAIRSRKPGNPEDGKKRVGREEGRLGGETLWGATLVRVVGRNALVNLRLKATTILQ